MALFREERLKHLRILGLKYDATEDDVKKTYKRLALKYHPDKCQNDPDATKRFQQLSAAYYGLKKLYEKERKCSCSCGYAHYEEDSDCSDYFDSDDEQDDDLLDFFRRIFMDVFSEFVFRKKFQSKKRRKDYHPDEEDEEDSFFEFLSKKFRSEGQSRTDDYLLTEEDLKKFKSYDEWQKARDPSKPHNRCKRKAVQKSRRYQKGEQKGDQKAPSKKQLKAEQQRKEKELKDIREELLKNLEEQKKRDHQKKKKAKNSSTKTDVTRSKAESSQDVRMSPERIEIESQLLQARQKERELEENLRRLEAQEIKKEKKLRKQEKKKAKKQQTDLENSLTEQLKKEDYYRSRCNEDFIYSQYEQDRPLGGARLQKGFSQPVSKQDRDKGLQDLMNRVKMKKSWDEGGGGGADTINWVDVKEPIRQHEFDKSVREHHTSQSESTYESEKLQEHLRAYHELMKLQPKRHTEQQLREERVRIRDAQFHNQQQELLQLRRDSANTGSHDDHALRMTMREEFLQRQREKELQRNQEELQELSRETAYRKNSSAPVAPLSRKHYESISYQEKHAQFERMEPVRHDARKKAAPIPLVEHPIKREIKNPETTWSRVVNSTTPWGERSRRQMELGTLLPQSTDEEERMLQEALALSVATEQQERRQRELYNEIQKADIDRRVKEAASRSTTHLNSVDHGQVERQRPQISKYPLSDKYQLYPGIDGSQDLPTRDEPTWSRPANRSDKTMICRPHTKKETWSICPGDPSPDDWSFTPSHGAMDTGQRQKQNFEEEEEEDSSEEEEEEEVDVHQQRGEKKWRDAHLPDFDYKQKNINWSAVPFGPVGSQQIAGQNSGFHPEIIQPKPLGLNFNLPSKDKRPVLQSTSTWDEECAWKLEGPSFPGQATKQNHLHLNEKAIDGFGSPVDGETSQQQSFQSSQTCDGLTGNNRSIIDKCIAMEASPQLTSEKNDNPVNVEMREVQTNTDPPEVISAQPETHDCFTQTKVSTGFVGGYWDSVSNNEEKIPVPEKPAPVQIPDPAILEMIPQRGCAPGLIPQGPKPNQNGEWLNDHKSTQDRMKKAKAENWDENLITSFSDLHMEKPAVNERAESSIAVNTSHENTTVPRLPVPQDRDQQSGRRMMTDDQKLSDQHRAGTGAGTSEFNHRGDCAVQDLGRTVSAGLNHNGFPSGIESRGPFTAGVGNEGTMSNGVDQGHSGSMNLGGPSTAGVELRAPLGNAENLVNGLPDGLPPHLIQAYMDFVSNNNAAQPGQQSTPVQNSPNGIPSDGEPCSSGSSLPNPGQTVGPQNPASMNGFGRPGFIPPMWPPMIPLMMAGPMMTQPMMPYCHPLYAYSLQQKRQQLQQPQEQQQQLPQQQLQQMAFNSNETNGQPFQNPENKFPEVLNASHSKETHEPQTQPEMQSELNQNPPQRLSVNGQAVPCKLEQLMVGSKHSFSGTSVCNQAVPGATPGHNQHGIADTLKSFVGTDSEDWDSDNKSTSLNGDSKIINSQPHQQPQLQINRGFIRPTLPPRFQRQKRLELKKKIQTFIKEIKKEDDDFTQTEIVNEENRVSS